MNVAAQPVPAVVPERPLKMRVGGWIVVLGGTAVGVVLPWYLTTLRPALAVAIMVFASVIPIVVALRVIRSKSAKVFGALALVLVLPIVFVLLPMECDRMKEMLQWERVDHGIRRVVMACRLYANRNGGALPPDLVTLIMSDLGSGTTSTPPRAPAQEDAAAILLPRGMSYAAFLELNVAGRVRALEQDPVFDYFGGGVREDMGGEKGVIILASREYMTNPRGSESGEDVDARRVAYADWQTGWVKRADWDAAWAKSEAARGKSK